MNKIIKVRYLLFAALLLTIASWPGSFPGPESAAAMGGARGVATRYALRGAAEASMSQATKVLPKAAFKSSPFMGRVAAGTVSRPLARELSVLARNSNWNAFHAVTTKNLAERGTSEAAAPLLRELADQGGTMKALQKLQAGITRSAPLPSAEMVESALKALPEGSRPGVLCYVSGRAQLEGNLDLARKLSGDQLPDAQAILRDMERLGASPGVPAGPTGPHNPLPVPEGPAISVHPAVKESLGKDLPALPKDLPVLDQLPAAELRARKWVLGEFHGSANWPEHRLIVHFAYTNNGNAPSLPAPPDWKKEDEGTEAAVETRLGRPLEPAERILIRHLRDKKTPEQLAAVVK